MGIMIKKALYVALSASLVIISVFAFSACSILSDAAELQEYDMSGDSVKTVNAVVGEREVTGVETGVTNGVINKQYTYESNSVFDDLMAYTQYLRENGWNVTQDYDLNVTPGNAQLAKESADTDKILVLSIAYEDSKYAIKITKGDGTLTSN